MMMVGGEGFHGEKFSEMKVNNKDRDGGGGRSENMMGGCRDNPLYKTFTKCRDIILSLLIFHVQRLKRARLYFHFMLVLSN